MCRLEHRSACTSPALFTVLLGFLLLIPVSGGQSAEPETENPAETAAGSTVEKTEPAADSFPRSLRVPVDRRASRTVEELSSLTAASGGTESLLRLQDLLDDPAVRFIETDGLLRNAVTAAGELQQRLMSAQLESLSGPAAKAALERASGSADQQALLLQIVHRYPHTKAGLEATLQLAWQRIDRAQFASAAALFRRALAHPQLAEAPRLRLEAVLALCLHQLAAGTGELPARGSRPVDSLFLQSLLPRHAEPRSVTEPAAGSTPAVVPGPAATEPLSTWQHDLGPAEPLRNLALAGIAEAARNGVLPLPAAVPIVWNDVVLVRSGEGLVAFHTGTGNLLWQHMPATRSVSLTKDSRLLRNDGFQELISRNEVFRILADDIHGRLTVADGTVYAVMEASQEESAGTARPMQTLGLPSPGETADVLVARGIRSGQELWQLNPATSAVVAAAAQGEKLEAGSVHLLGPPLVKAHEYFVCLAAGDTLLLLCGDTQTGEPEWAIPLGTTGRVDSNVIRRSLAAAPLAYAGGLLICGTASGAVAGVDLATRQVNWLRRYRRDDVTVADGLPQGRLNRHQNIRWWEGWRESSLHTDGQTVLIATPESDTLRAIDAATGQELWVRPRAEGLLVGRLTEEAVYVLGRETVDAVRIADGSRLWHLVTGRPSGRPAVQGNQLLLPLETGEILRIHSGTGAAASAVLTAVGPAQKTEELTAAGSAREEAAGSILAAGLASGEGTEQTGDREPPPGNLAAIAGGVISVQTDGIQRLADSTTARQLLVARLADAPDTVDLLSQLAELEQSTGNLAAAEKLLSRAVALLDAAEENTEAANSQRAGLEGGQAQLLLAQLAAGQAGPAAVLAELDQRKSRSGNQGISLPALRQISSALVQNGQGTAAARLWIDAAARIENALLTVEPGHQVRADRLLQAELCDLLADLAPAQRQLAVDAMTARLEELRAGGDSLVISRLASRLERLPWARASSGSGGPSRSLGLGLMELELQLHERLARYRQRPARNSAALLPWLLVTNSDREQDGERIGATSQPRGLALVDEESAAHSAWDLARLLQSHSFASDAADAWRLLDGPFSATLVTDGQTGRETVAALGADSAVVREVRQGPLEEWSRGKPESEVSQQRQRGVDFKTVPVVPVAGSFAHRLRVLVNSDGSRVRFQGDGQRGSWELKLPDSDSPFRVAVPLHQGWGLGHLIVLRVGMDLMAIEPLDDHGEPRARLVWHRPLYDGPPLRWDHLMLGIEPERPGFHLPRIRVLDRYGRVPGAVGPVGCGVLCLHSGSSLIAVEPGTGETLWQRNDLPTGCRTVGDELFIIILEEHSPQVRILRTLDGTQLGTRTLEAAPEEMLLVSGRNALLERTTPAGTQLVSVDLVSGIDSWSVPLGPNEAAFHDGATRIGVFRHEGAEARVTLYEPESGRQAGSSVLPLPEALRNPEKMPHLIAWADRQRVYLTVSGVFTRPENEQINRSRGDFRQVLVNGLLAAFSVDSARHLWSASLEDAAVRLEQPADTPLLLVDYWQVEPGKKTGARIDGILQCLDRRTGETIYREQRPRRNGQMTVDTYREQGLVEVRMPDRSIRLSWPVKN